MSSPSRALGGRRALRPFQLIDRLADGSEASPVGLLQLLPTSPEQLTEVLIDAAVRHAGTQGSQTVCRRHLQERNWAKWLPLASLEYRVLLGRDPRFELGIRGALTRSGWATRHRRELELSKRPRSAAAAALALRSDLDAVALEASSVVARVASLRAQIEPPLHAVQVQALMRAEEALGDLRGVRALDIGCAAGALVDALRKRGTAVVGIDLAPPAGASGVDIVRADFANGLPPASYDLVLATGVFEAGSCRAGAPQGHSLCGGQLLSRLRSVTARGGIVVLENFGLPLPFSLSIARAAGFELVPQTIPAVNLALGGRGCTLRRVR